jgi:hypothetical protein
MRVFGQWLFVVCLVTMGVFINAQSAPPARPAPQAAGQQPPPAAQPAPPSQASIDAAAKILAAARTALGGEAKQGAVKTIAATGRTRRVSGENLVPVEFEIDIELPDKYVRKDEIPAREEAPSASGFSGENLIQIPPRPHGRRPHRLPAAPLERRLTRPPRRQAAAVLAPAARARLR